MSELERARRAVREARTRVESQRALIGGLRRNNFYTGDLEKVLQGYEAELAQAEAYLDRISKETG